MVGRALNLLECPKGNDLLHAQAARHLRFDPSLFSAGSAQYDYLAAQSIHTICIDTDNPEALLWEHPQPRATAGTSDFTGLDESVHATAGAACQHFDQTKPYPASIEQCCEKFDRRAIVAEAGIPAFCLPEKAADIQRSAAGIPSTADSSQSHAAVAATSVGRGLRQVAPGAVVQASDSFHD